MPQKKKRYQPEERKLANLVGTRIQFLRLERGLSLRAVAETGGCSISALSSIEYGLASMTTGTLFAIAKGLNVQPFDLLNHDPDDSDVGFLLEAMRQHPECIAIVKAKLSALA